MYIRVLLAYAIAIILWASAFPTIRVGLDSFQPLHLSMLRLLIGSIGLLIFALATRMRLPDTKDILPILVLGFLGFSVYHTFLSIGEETVDAGTASLVVSTTPLFSALLARFFLKEYFGKYGWIGSVIAFFGVSLITFGSTGEFKFEWGVLIILTAALGESFYFVLQSNYLKKYGFLPFTTYTIWAGTLCMLFFSPGITGAIQDASMESLMTVIYLGLLPTVIPYFAIAYATAKQGASEATSALYLTPALAIVISWIWIGEIPTLLSIVGGIIVLIGVSLSTIFTIKEKEVEKGTSYAKQVSKPANY
ncbi:DMT family transporter [Halobacillus sp. Marseille-P3879]|uniref:DMT family transporter n=1 Tax=Halobacillus sp. Marseille-P3879 TaxID=2045014 RepID=UPI000C7D13C2|nr:DMT family transporter [Halobacillus sp. Marseille-P3879]